MTTKRDSLSKKARIIYLSPENISANRDQPRRHFDSARLNELAASIRENGILQPLTVKREERGYMLVSGERRLRAAYIAGLRKIPCIVIDAERDTVATLPLVENLQRDNLSFYDEALGISKLMGILNCTQEQLAKRLGISKTALSNKLHLLKLEDRIITRLLDLHLTEWHAHALLRLHDEEDRKSALDYISENKLSASEAEDYISQLLKTRQESTEIAHKNMPEAAHNIHFFCTTIDLALKTMRQAGFRAEPKTEEDESTVTFKIKIFK